MIYQLNVLSKLIRKDLFKLFLIFAILFSFNVIVIYFSYGEPTINDFNAMLGVLNADSASFMAILWLLFQIFATIYVSYRYCFYENENSPEFLFLRLNFKKIILHKFCILTLFITMYRGFYYFLTFLIFHTKSYFSILLFVKNTIFFVGISLIMLLFYLMFIVVIRKNDL